MHNPRRTTDCPSNAYLPEKAYGAGSAKFGTLWDVNEPAEVF
jgi:hypothetical protein